MINTYISGSIQACMALTPDSLYRSTCTLRFAGAVTYEIHSSGLPAVECYNTDEFDCTLTIADPTFDMLSTARELAFRSGIWAALNNITKQPMNPNNTQSIEVTQSQDLTVYRAEFPYHFPALAITLFALVSILPSYRGWWLLGRTFSLSPIKIAKAFDALELARGHELATDHGYRREMDANADVEMLLAVVGKRRARYGVVRDGGKERLGFGSSLGRGRPSEGMVYGG
jgi:hypothetical protein